MQITRLKNHIEDSDISYYENSNQGWTVLTRDCLAVEWENGTKTTFVIFSGPFTLEEMCRDCGDYYELSTGGRIYYIEKQSLIIKPFK